MKTLTGIVLKKVEKKPGLIEVTLYTKEEGKLVVYSNSGKKKKGAASEFELFTAGQYSVSNTSENSIPMVKESDILDSFSFLRRTLKATLYAEYFIELLNETTVGNKEDNGLFEFIYKCLSAMNMLLKITKEPAEISSKLDLLLTYFDINILSYLGYFPHLDNCVGCGKHSDYYYFSFNKYGVICPDCKKSNDIVRRINTNTIADILKFSSITITQLLQLDYKVEYLALIRGIVEDYIKFCTDITEFKTLELLKTLL